MNLLSRYCLILASLGTIWIASQPYRLGRTTAHILPIVGIASTATFTICLIVSSMCLCTRVNGSLRRSRDFVSWTAILVVSIIGLGYYGFVYVGAHSTTSDLNTCINNLKRLDAVCEEIAQERGLSRGTTIPKAEFSQRCGGQVPNCPSGGTYEYGVVGELPTCSFLKHELR